MINIGEKIKELRKSRGYSLRKLGERMNIAYTHISNIENGKKKPNLDFIYNLSEIFDVPSSYFLDGEELTSAEKDLISNLDLTDEELMNKYNLVLDGEEVSEQEIIAALSFIRTMRATQNKNKE